MPSWPTPSSPFKTLSQRISQQQAELEKLRREYAARQDRLDKLARRKKQLQDQLKQVEAEIAGFGPAKPPTPKPTAAVPAPAKPTPVAPKPVAPTPAAPKPVAAKGAAAPAEKVSLPKLLVQIVSEAKRPITSKELVAEVVRRSIPPRATVSPRSSKRAFTS